MTVPTKPDPSAETGAEGGKQDTGPKLSPLEQALADARERQSGEAGTMLPTEEEKKSEETGTGDQATGESEAEAGEDEDDGDAEGGEASGETDEGAAAESEEGETEAEAGEDAGDTTESESTAEGDDTGEEEVDPDLIVGLPPRREGDDEVEIVAENQEVAERLRQLKNQAVAGERLQQREEKVSTDQAQIEEMEILIGTDPIGFILANVPDDTVGLLTLGLVTDDKVLAVIKDKLFPALNDEKELRTLRAEIKGARAEAKNTLRDTVEIRKHAKKQAKVVRDTIRTMVPVTDGISESRRSAIIEQLENAAGEAVRTKKLETIAPEDLPVLLSTALRAQGIDPLAASEAIKNGGTDSEAGSKSPPKKKVKRPTTKQLKSASKKRSKAAASTPPGGSAPALRQKLPEGQGIEERLKLAREKGLGALLGR